MDLVPFVHLCSATLCVVSVYLFVVACTLYLFALSRVSSLPLWGRGPLGVTLTAVSTVSCPYDSLIALT